MKLKGLYVYYFVSFKFSKSQRLIGVFFGVLLYFLFFQGIGVVYAMEPDNVTLLDKIAKVNENISYFEDQVNAARDLYNEAVYAKNTRGIDSDFQAIAQAYNENLSNLNSEKRLLGILDNKLANGETSPEISTSSSLGKRKADASDFEINKK